MTRERLESVGLVRQAAALAARAAGSTLVMAAPFVLAAGLYGASLGFGAGPSFVAALAVFVAGVWYSLSIYRAMMGTRGGALVSLAHANLAIYVAFLFVGVFIGFFLLILPGILLEAAGYEDLGSDTDPQVVIAALRDMLPTPYGVVLVVVNVLGAGCLAFFALRLLLVGPATVAAGRAMVFRTWRWTEGHTVRLGLAALVTHIAPFAFAAAVNGGIQAVLPGDGAVFAGLSSGLGAALLLPFILLGHGLAVAAHERLSPRE